jgi:AraC family transcriptional regulator of adaptative response/methylated-DNA-[protein]-cysteine methyltransferase
MDSFRSAPHPPVPTRATRSRSARSGTGPASGREPDARAEAVLAACRALEASEAGIPLAVLARAAGWSPWHFQRLFKVRTGVSPKQYFKAVQAQRLRRALSGGARVTDAILDAGYDSAGRFYSERSLGMRPRTWRDAGAGACIRYAIARSSLGPVLIAATERGLCTIEFGDDPAALVAALRQRFARATLARGDREFRARVAGVVRSIEEPRAALELPLDVRGTAFQRRVWNALRAIPAGATTTYAELARRIDAPRAVRAVARACASNPLAVVVPCHRVVRGDGGLAGYRWGIERKAELLRREASVVGRPRSETRRDPTG